MESRGFVLEKVGSHSCWPNMRLLREKCRSLQNMRVLVSLTQLDQHGSYVSWGSYSVFLLEEKELLLGHQPVLLLTPLLSPLMHIRTSFNQFDWLKQKTKLMQELEYVLLFDLGWFTWELTSYESQQIGANWTREARGKEGGLEMRKWPFLALNELLKLHHPILRNCLSLFSCCFPCSS